MPTFIDKFDTEIEYADEAEVLDYCNKVRQAGGGEVIDALLPGIPSAAGSCMIARSLNFDSSVYPGSSRKSGRWVMETRSEEIAQKLVNAGLGEQLGLTAIHLPKRIGLAAYAFDERQGWTHDLITTRVWTEDE